MILSRDQLVRAFQRWQRDHAGSGEATTPAEQHAYAAQAADLIIGYVREEQFPKRKESK